MREILIEKATEMFMKLGFKSVTMDDIAAELGISKKTIYQHFSNKHDLVEATTMNVFDNINCGITNIRSMGKNSIEEIFVIRSFIMEHMNNDDTSPYHQLQKFFPRIFMVLRRKQLDCVNECMLENLQKGINNGLYRKNLDINFISRIYFTGLIGIKDNEIFPATIFNPVYLTKQFMEYHLRGIVTKKGLEVLDQLLADDIRLS